MAAEWRVGVYGPSLLRCENSVTGDVIYDRVEASFSQSRICLYKELADAVEKMWTRNAGSCAPATFDTEVWHVVEEQHVCYWATHKPSGKLCTWRETQQLFAFWRFEDTSLCGLRNLASRIQRDFYSAAPAPLAPTVATTNAIPHAEGWLHYHVGKRAGIFFNPWRRVWVANCQREPTTLHIWKRRDEKRAKSEGDLIGLFDLRELDVVKVNEVRGKTTKDDRGAFLLQWRTGRQPLRLIADGAESVALWKRTFTAIAKFELHHG